MKKQAKDYAEKVSRNYSHGPRDLDTKIVEYSYALFTPYIRGEILEIGPSDGIMTRWLMRDFGNVSVVEPTLHYSRSIRRLFPEIPIYRSFIEELTIKETFDTVILGHVLEHVVDVRRTLRAISRVLKPGGRLLIAVPNAHSLHRQIGVRMGLLTRVTALNATDRKKGHYRVYTAQTLRRDVRRAGMEVRHMGGYLLKIFPNHVIEKSWKPELVSAFFDVGTQFPDIAAELYCVCELPAAKTR
jgi:2-polyprenyl-3-methyl-5-hydroxy-6-metoxy-1,4-benzoquinol methylase